MFYNKSKILCGKRALQNLPYEIRQWGCGKPMIITEESPAKVNDLNTLLKSFSGDNLDLTSVYPKVHSEFPTTESAEKFAEMFKADGCDCIVAMGGHSAQAIAKVAKVLLEQEEDSVEGLTDGINLAKKTIPLALVTINYATANEGVGLVNIYNTEKNLRYQLVSHDLEPELIVIDEQMIDLVEVKDIAQNILQGLGFAIEAFLLAPKNMMVRAYVNTTLRLLGQNAQYMLLNARDKQRKTKLAVARVYAGIASSNAGAGKFNILCGTMADALDKQHLQMVSLMFYPYFNERLEGCLLGDLLTSVMAPELYIYVDDAEQEVRNFIERLVTICAKEGQYNTFLMAYTNGDLGFLQELETNLLHARFTPLEVGKIKDLLIRMAEERPKVKIHNEQD